MLRGGEAFVKRGGGGSCGGTVRSTYCLLKVLSLSTTPQWWMKAARKL